jgi:PAS domain S-box-containing protein
MFLMSLLRRVIKPPRFEDAQKTRLAVLLHQITLGLAGLAVIYLVVSTLLSYHLLNVAFGLLVFTACMVMNFLGRKGYTQEASIGLVSSLWVLFSLAMFFGGGAGVFDASFTAYIIPIAIAGYLINGRAGWVFAFMSIASGAIALIAHGNSDQVPFSDLRSTVQWIAESILFIAVAYSLALTRKSLMDALTQVQHDERKMVERQRAESAFRVQYERLLHAFHAAGLETWVWNMEKEQTTYPDTEPAIAVHFPQSLTEFFNNIHPDDRDRVKAIIFDALETKTEFETVYRLYNHGELEWYYTQASIDYDDAGKVTGFSGSSFDISSRKIAEEGLHVSEAAAHAFQEKLKALHGVSIELSQAVTLDDLYRKSVSLARQQLGFQRIGLFLMVPDDPYMVVGTYGIDTHGQLRNEHNLRFSIENNQMVREALSSQRHVAVLHDTDLWDYSDVIGKGWNALALLWNQSKAIGWLAADNLLDHTPLDDDQLELLSLYGSLLGPLILKKQAELETRRHQDRLRLALQTGGMITWTWNISTQEVTLDSLEPGGVDAVVSVAEIYQQVHPDDVLMVQKALDRATTENIPYAVEYRTKLTDDAIHWVYALGQVYHDETGKALGLVGVSQDITERKQAEERFYKAFDLNPSAIAITTFDEGRYLEVNAAWLRLTGFSRHEIMGHTSVEVGYWDRAEDREHFMKIFNEQGFLRDMEMQIGGKDGRKIPVRMLVEKVELNGETCFLTMLQDTTKQREAEAQALELALQRERVDLLTEFMGNVSHDIKTPLTAINTSLYLLERTEDVGKQREKLELIRTHTRQLEKFIQDMLTISRLDYSPSLDLKPITLNRLLQDIDVRLRSTVEKKNLSLVLELDPVDTPVMGDFDELDRALVNLVENAVNYTPSGGSVRVRTLNGDGSLVAEISDTGIGIAEADIANIFTRFYRAEAARSTHDAGTGLGLAIVKKIVEMHKGSIEVISAVGQGSTFRIRLPAVVDAHVPK